MDRTIKFRGKRIDCGYWIEGGFVEWTDMRGNIYHQIVSGVGYHNDIIPSTLGQFTGLFDMNGKEIYEGDVFRIWLEDAVEPKGGIFAYHIVTWVKDRLLLLQIGFDYNGDFSDQWTLSKELSDPEWEYIGSIHDHPELINTK